MLVPYMQFVVWYIVLVEDAPKLVLVALFLVVGMLILDVFFQNGYFSW